MKLNSFLVLLFILAISFKSFSQTSFVDSIFNANKGMKCFEYKSSENYIKIGNLIKDSRSALVYNPLESEFNYLVRFYVFTDKWTEIYKDTIDSNDLSEIVFKDMNHDSINDVIISIISGQDGYSFLYVFNDSISSLEKVRGFGDFQEVNFVRGDSAYLYSYNHIGCADNTWESILFQIVGSKIVEYSKLEADCCRKNKISISDLKNKSVREQDIQQNEINSICEHKFKYLDEFWCKCVKAMIQD